MKEPGEIKGARAEYSKLGKKNGIEEAKGKESSGKESKVREGSSKEKKLEEKNARVEGKEGWIIHDGKKCDGKKSDEKTFSFVSSVSLMQNGIEMTMTVPKILNTVRMDSLFLSGRKLLLTLYS